MSSVVSLCAFEESRLRCSNSVSCVWALPKSSWRNSAWINITRFKTSLLILTQLPCQHQREKYHRHLMWDHGVLCDCRFLRIVKLTPILLKWKSSRSYLLSTHASTNKSLNETTGGWDKTHVYVTWHHKLCNGVIDSILQRGWSGPKYRWKDDIYKDCVQWINLVQVGFRGWRLLTRW